MSIFPTLVFNVESYQLLQESFDTSNLLHATCSLLSLQAAWLDKLSTTSSTQTLNKLSFHMRVSDKDMLACTVYSRNFILKKRDIWFKKDDGLGLPYVYCLQQFCCTALTIDMLCKTSDKFILLLALGFFSCWKWGSPYKESEKQFIRILYLNLIF